jgi:ABC-2 type transport system ATP-binding protein
VIALQHRPELLVLDEPTSGLDPLVQQTFTALIREAQAEGRTVFLSSHVLGEVEKLCDRVAIIRDGRLIRVDEVSAFRDLAHHEVELRFAEPVTVADFADLPGVSDVVADDHTLRLRVVGPITPVVRAAARYELLDFVSREPSLEESFLAAYAGAAQ